MPTNSSIRSGYSAVNPYAVLPCPRCGQDVRHRHRKDYCPTCKAAAVEADKQRRILAMRARRAKAAAQRAKA